MHISWAFIKTCMNLSFVSFIQIVDEPFSFLWLMADLIQSKLSYFRVIPPLRDLSIARSIAQLSMAAPAGPACHSSIPSIDPYGL
uniref:Uncharacterized protein n=1 Tax=Picea glauca TaxID=3330 RepID=A0A124GN54_PICGL|nr:hypothetical protein ABT39_MTgene5939 [Picea glauca]